MTTNDERYEIKLYTIKRAYVAIGLPLYMWPGLERYLEHGYKPGQFLTAILSNDLAMACQHADDENKVLLHTWTKFLHNNVPMVCWGSIENFRNWANQHGFQQYNISEAL